MNKLLAALVVGAFAFGSLPALAQADKTQSFVLTPAEQAKLKAERDAARAKWAAMTPEQKAATRKTMQAKRVSELTTLEIVGQENDNSPLAETDASQDQAKFKAERVSAKAKWDAMTPEEKAATRKAAQAKKLSELTMVEKMSVGQ
jgi:hypothetical protein